MGLKEQHHDEEQDDEQYLDYYTLGDIRFNRSGNVSEIQGEEQADAEDNEEARRQRCHAPEEYGNPYLNR
jgi:hypothetical protein